MSLDEEPDKHPDPEVDMMQDDVIALIQAWQDRGITIDRCAQLLASVGHAMLIRLDFKLGELILGAVEQWREHDGVI